MNEKMIAAATIMWLLSTIYFTLMAIRGNYPIYYGVATSSVCIGLAVAITLLLRVILQ